MMTKMEIIALQGIVSRLSARKNAPKPDWMSEDMHLGKTEAYDEAVREMRELIEAAKE